MSQPDDLLDLPMNELLALIAGLSSDVVDLRRRVGELERRETNVGRLDARPLIWLTVSESASRAGRNPQTVRKAVEAGELHGSQRKRNGRWRIHVDCLDAWCAGKQCEHQWT